MLVVPLKTAQPSPAEYVSLTLTLYVALVPLHPWKVADTLTRESRV